MGGNALKHLGTERKNAQQYHFICNSITDVLSKCCTRIDAIPAYRNKRDFGDADILVIPKEKIDIKKCIENLFSPREISTNDNCHSFDYDNFQIDVIETTSELYDTTYSYYSYNDLGNLIGRIAHKLGLKYGHEGLLMPIRDNEIRGQNNIVVTRDTAKALEFLGYNSNVFAQGFDNLNDIFDFVINTKYFNRDIFAFENLNHINRVRNRKRKVYAQFLDYIQDKNISTHYIFNSDKTVYQQIIDQAFPEIYLFKSLERINQEIQLAKNIKNKLNGIIISDITKLQDKKLGMFISYFKNMWGSVKEYEEWVLNTNTNDIYKHVANVYNAYVCQN